MWKNFSQIYKDFYGDAMLVPIQMGIYVLKYGIWKHWA